MVTAWGTTRTPRHIINMMVISIHVPAWGTTLRQLNKYMLLAFQSTFPRGERQFPTTIPVPPKNFNPRSRVGNDDSNDCKPHTIINFNPRSRVGND